MECECRHASGHIIKPMWYHRVKMVKWWDVNGTINSDAAMQVSPNQVDRMIEIVQSSIYGEGHSKL
jgi:hypothetical protein